MFTAITAALPILLLALLEGVLRLLHYGPDLRLFVAEEIRGTTYQIMNPGVKDRYFYRVAFNPATSPDYFLRPKPNGAYRIFCFGGSTTVGFPYYYNASFASLLRQRLEIIFPEKQIEVINIGMTATNSFTTLDMAEDVVDEEPDLLIVYDGHNEFYGALGAASRESSGSSRWLTRLSLRLIHYRSYLLFRDAAAAVGRLFGGTPLPEPGIGMMEKLARGKTIPSESDTYRDALGTFDANLAALRSLARERRIPLIVATQVSNLRDQKPFVSSYPAWWGAEERNRFERLVNAGLERLMENDPRRAGSLFRQGLDLHPGHAEARYHLGKGLDRLGLPREAEREYARARDDDALRFRTSSAFNDAIRRLDDGGTTACADMEALFRRNSPDSLIGNSLLLEHLHPNVRGHFLMAREYARVMRERGFLASAEEWERRDTISDTRLWDLRPVTELDERTAARRTEILMSAWPFTDGSGIIPPVSPGDTLGEIADRITRGLLYWHVAHQEAIRYHERRGDRAALEWEYRTLIAVQPLLDVQPYLRLAHIMLEQNRLADVRVLLDRSLRVTPTILAYRALGDIALRSGEGKAASAYYEETLRFPQSAAEEAENGYLLALAYRAAGEPDRAIARLTVLLARAPDYPPARDLLDELRRQRLPSGSQNLPAK